MIRRMRAGLIAIISNTGHLHHQFGRAESRWKHDGTRVTAADLAISKGIFAELSAGFPEDQFFSEETEPGGGPVPLRSRFTWLLDPIDGTNNFALGVPCCAISLALLEGGTPVCGFIYDLALRTIFHGGPLMGVMADGTTITRRPFGTGDIKIVAMHSPIDPKHLPIVERVLVDYKLRGFGSGTLHLAYVALGRIDACMDFTVKIWDIAAAWAFCQATGVEVHFFNGPVFPLREFDLHMQPVPYLAGGPEACAELLPKLRALGALT